MCTSFFSVSRYASMSALLPESFSMVAYTMLSSVGGVHYGMYPCNASFYHVHLVKATIMLLRMYS